MHSEPELVRAARLWMMVAGLLGAMGGEMKRPSGWGYSHEAGVQARTCEEWRRHLRRMATLVDSFNKRWGIGSKPRTPCHSKKRSSRYS